MKYVTNIVTAAFVAAISVACGSAHEETGTSQAGAAVTAKKASPKKGAPTACPAGTHPESDCSADVERACRSHSVSTCENDSRCLAVCAEGSPDCSKDAYCDIDGSQCPVKCVTDPSRGPGPCGVPTGNDCVDPVTGQSTDPDCCWPAGGGAE